MGYFLILFCYFAELAQMKSTPTDSEVAVQMDETGSKVRARARIHSPLFYLAQSHAARCIIQDMQPVSTAKLDALDAELIKWCSEWIRRRKVLHKWAHLFLLLSRLLKERPNAPTDLFSLYEWKLSGHSLPTHCPHRMLSSWQKILGSITICPNISS